MELPRRITHRKNQSRRQKSPARRFDYSLDYHRLNLRKHPEFYRVGVGEQGVLLVEPYKSEILPLWRFRSPEVARVSSREILRKFHGYKKNEDFVGMDMARKFLQMGFTRSRRYANRRSGRKYSSTYKLLPFDNDPVKAASAEIFRKAWKEAEADPDYLVLKQLWRLAFG